MLETYERDGVRITLSTHRNGFEVAKYRGSDEPDMSEMESGWFFCGAAVYSDESSARAAFDEMTRS